MIGELPRNCRDCQFRANKSDPYGCNYALITKHTRKAAPPGDGCVYKIHGKRLDPNRAGVTIITRPREYPFLAAELSQTAKKTKKHTELNPDRHPTAINPEDALALYQQGMNDTQIANALECSIPTVQRWRAAIGLPLNGISRLDKEKALEMVKAGKSDREIALELGVSRNTVFRWRQKNKIPAAIPTTHKRMEELYETCY